MLLPRLPEAQGGAKPPGGSRDLPGAVEVAAVERV
jgi:hypothetical protein